MNQHQMQIMGRATDQPETLTTSAGKEFAKFTVAVNEYRGEDKERAVYFYNVACFKKQPMSVSKKVNKGDIVFVVGKPEVQAYISKDGEAKASVNLNAAYATCFLVPPYVKKDSDQQENKQIKKSKK